MKKNVNKPMATCHDIGACLLHPDDCACIRACLLQTEQAQRLAPGVIDGPYYPAMSRTDRIAKALLLAASVMTSVVLLAGLARLVGWL